MRTSRITALCLASTALAAITITADTPSSADLPTGSAITISATATLAGSAPQLSTSYYCNPAHQYPNGGVCISTSGRFTIISATTTHSAPAVSASAVGDCRSEYRLCASAGTSSVSSICATQLQNCENVCKLQLKACEGTNGDGDETCEHFFHVCLGRKLPGDHFSDLEVETTTIPATYATAVPDFII